jgi:DNA (cytosine-5)-methyltransferase 1
VRSSHTFHRATAPAGMFDELIVDNFAGGGGVSMGLERAFGRAVDVAINHDPASIEMHRANHPHTLHLCEDVFHVSPLEVTAGRPVGLAWFSPDCKHFSNAKGSKPVEKKIRGLAWIVIRWARRVRPRVIMLENVREFEGWGPLTPENRPCPVRKGETFRLWLSQLTGLGYDVQWRILNAADYGAQTHRRRLFIVARCDGQPIVWPQPTHGPGRSRRWRTAAECIDWSLPCPSIFERRKPLAEKTQRRIAMGLWRYVINNPRPFIVNIERSYKDFAGQRVDDPLGTVTAHPRGGKHSLVVPSLVANYGEAPGQAPRASSVQEPLGTVVATPKHSVVAAFIARNFHGEKQANGADEPLTAITTQTNKHTLAAAYLTEFRGSNRGKGDPRQPMPAVTAQGTHIAEVRAVVIKYFGQGCGQECGGPLHTVTCRDRFGLVMVDGVEHVIADIGLRMLTPRELARAQGFPDDYVLTGTKTSQVARIGNSVCPVMSEVLARANCVELVSQEVVA